MTFPRLTRKNTLTGVAEKKSKMLSVLNNALNYTICLICITTERESRMTNPFGLVMTFFESHANCTNFVQ